MGKVKSKGEQIHIALVKAGLRDHEDWIGLPNEQPMFEQAAQEYEKATSADLPADVDAFLAEVEARADKATPGPWITSNQYGRTAIATPHSPYDSRNAIAGHYGIADTNADFITHTRADVPALLGIIRTYQQNHAFTMREWTRDAERTNAAEAERDELRERLSALELAARDALNLLGPEYFDDGKPLAELGRLVNIKGDQTTERNDNE